MRTRLPPSSVFGKDLRFVPDFAAMLKEIEVEVQSIRQILQVHVTDYNLG